MFKWFQVKGIHDHDTAGIQLQKVMGDSSQEKKKKKKKSCFF